MPLDQRTAALWCWLPSCDSDDASDLLGDLLIDLRPAKVRVEFPVPERWRTDVTYPSDGTAWLLEAMLVPNPTANCPHACSGFWRFTSPAGFRFVVAVRRDSKGGDLPVGVFSSVMPSLRQVVTSAPLGSIGPDPVRETTHPVGAWEYTLDGLLMAVKDPHAWFGLPGPARPGRRTFLVSSTKATFLLKWALAGVGADEAAVWARAGFTPVDVGRWTRPRAKDPWTRFTPDDARAWGPVFGVKNPKTADSWRRGGFSPSEALHWKSVRELREFSVLPSPRQWAKVRNADLRHAYMSAGFSGAEVGALETSLEPPTVEAIEVLAALRGTTMVPRPV